MGKRFVFHTLTFAFDPIFFIKKPMNDLYKKIGLTLAPLGLLLTLNAQSFELLEDYATISQLRDVNGVSVADYDQDGDLDIFLVSIYRFEANNPQTWSRLLQNNGENGFEDVTETAQLLVENKTIRRGWMGDRMGASWGDYDNDGYPDLFLSNDGGDELWRNKGAGTFENVTEKAGVQGCSDCYSSNGLWWDYDLDGDLDLYVSDWLRVNRMHENQGDGTFLDVSQQSGLADTSKTWTSIPLDVNQDLLPDLYIVNDFGPNKLMLNQGDGTFQEKTTIYGLEDVGDGMGVDICDYNNDGHFDIYVTNIFRHEPNPFFVNNGQNRFINLAKPMGIDNTGWGWGARFFDADHDMDEDLYVVNGMNLSAGRGDKNVFFENTGTRFIDISANLGVDNAKQARGLEVFDYDLDGDLDMIVGNRAGKQSFYHNNLLENNATATNWLQIKLIGTISNRDALGAVVKISCDNQTYFRHYSGANLMGQSIKPIHYGLANHDRVDEIEVTWPNGVKEYFNSVAANQVVKLIEEEGSSESSLNIISSIDQRLAANIQVFPNPFINQLSLEIQGIPAENIKFRLTNIAGQTIVEYQKRIAQNGTIRLEFSENNLPNGLYFYSVISSLGTKTGTIIKHH